MNMMDPPNLVLPSLSIINTAPTTATLQNHHPDSVDSSPSPSPRYSSTDHIVETTWPDQHEPLPHVPNAKLRLMCSYGGHIMPRPHDKSLSYFGGETRIVAVDRHSSLKDLYARLSHSLLHGRPFTLKYQLPNEDLDNLITVTTDEDLNNMIEEHDRLLASSKLSVSPSSRLRMFLFFSKPDTAVSMSAVSLSLLDDAKSETWFVDALNNSGINLQRGVSDSAAADQCLVNLDGVHESNNDLEGQVVVVVELESNPIPSPTTDVVDTSNKEVKHEHEVHSVSVVVMENDSLYGSSSSASSMANMPPSSSGVKHLLDDGYNAMSSADPMNRVNVSDDDRSDHHHHHHVAQPAGIGIGYRKPPLPLQLVQPRTSTGGFGLPSPDSLASDSSIASANSFSKTVYYHEQVQAEHIDNKAHAMPNIKSDQISDQSPILQREQVQDSGYTLPQQLDQNQQLQHQQQQQQQQQQFVYIHHHAATGQVPISSYYQLYAPPSQQQQQQLHHPIGQQQYPVYVMPVGPTQQYNMTLQSNIVDPNVTKSATPTIPQGAPSVYKANVASNPAFVHIPPNQFQQQYVGLSQNIHHQPHPIAIAPSATISYGYEYDGPTQDQVHYTQQQATTLQPPQYQSMTPAAAAAALSDVSKQFPMDNIQPPSRNSQPVQIN